MVDVIGELGTVQTYNASIQMIAKLRIENNKIFDSVYYTTGAIKAE